MDDNDIKIQSIDRMRCNTSHTIGFSFKDSFVKLWGGFILI